MNSRLRFTRRQFLRTTLAVSAPLVLPSGLWAAEDKPSARLTLGFIGMGKQNGSLLGDFLRRSQVQVLAVCDVDKTRREHAKTVVETSYAKKSDQRDRKSV